MSALLDAPIAEVDVETGEQTSLDPQYPDTDMTGLLGKFAEPQGDREYPLGDPNALLPPSGEFFPVSPDAGPSTTLSDASADNSQQSLPPIPPSPGESLLKDFDSLYHKYERRVYRQCYRILGNQQDAEDLAQEVFLRLFRKAHTFRGESSFSTWLHRLTINTVLMELRRQRRWRESVTSLNVTADADEGMREVLAVVHALTTPAKGMLDKIGLDVAIAELPSGYKEIFLLHDLEGYRHDEIAKLLGISEGTSKSQLHKARLRLRVLMAPANGRSGRHRRAAAVRTARKKCCRSPQFPLL